MTFTQARRRLAALVAQKGSQVQLANEIGCSESHLSFVLSGDKSFGLKYALAIQEKFGIPAAAWSTRRSLKTA